MNNGYSTEMNKRAFQFPWLVSTPGFATKLNFNLSKGAGFFCTWYRVPDARNIVDGTSFIAVG